MLALWQLNLFQTVNLVHRNMGNRAYIMNILYARNALHHLLSKAVWYCCVIEEVEPEPIVPILSEEQA